MTATTTTMTRKRSWQGPALFGYGYRPFFLFGALQAALMVALWVLWQLDLARLPSGWPPVAWHAHELLFGYVPAVVAGFLLTAVPNWTGRLPVVGWPLLGLVLVWLLGRVAVAAAGRLDPTLVALASLAFLAALIAVVGREIVAARNWRNLRVLVAVVALLLAQALFHLEVEHFGDSIYGDRLAIASILSLIMLVGGRIVPSFTTNWLKKQAEGPLPAGFSRFDAVAIAVAVLGLIGWVAQASPAVDGRMVAPLLALAGGLHLVRLARWQPQRTFAEPLVTVLHVGYGFIPLGFLLAAAGAWLEPLAAGAVHAWTVGAVGTMTLAVMTRASLGHSGRPLVASAATVAIYAAVVIAALARITAATTGAPPWLTVAGLAWTAAFAVFALAYGPMLLAPRRPEPRR